MVFAFCVAVGVAGISIAVGGEWNARRQLPPGMRSPEAIQYYFDGSVCLSCEMWGFMLMVAAFIMACGAGLIGLFSEFAHPGGADKSAGE